MELLHSIKRLHSTRCGVTFTPANSLRSTACGVMTPLRQSLLIDSLHSNWSAWTPVTPNSGMQCSVLYCYSKWVLKTYRIAGRSAFFAVFREPHESGLRLPRQPHAQPIELDSCALPLYIVHDSDVFKVGHQLPVAQFVFRVQATLYSRCVWHILPTVSG